MATNPRKNPCPGCGPSAPLTVRVGADASRHVYCRTCGYMGPSEDNAKLAIYAHNLGTARGERRPELTSIPEQFILDRSMPESKPLAHVRIDVFSPDDKRAVIMEFGK